MSLDNIQSQIQQKLAMAAGLNAKVLFDFGDDGKLYVDSTQSPVVIEQTEAPEEPDLTLICSKDTFEGILSGSQDPNIAFMMGKLKVKGSMGLAMKLNGILED